MAKDSKKTTPAASTPLSLSEAILAPLDAVFKAQVHSARSFINFLFQMAYPHIPVDANGHPKKGAKDEEAKKPYTFDISYLKPDGTSGTIKIPSLAMLPVTPLGVEEADIKFTLTVEEVSSHRQLQSSEQKATAEEGDHYDRSKRPWFLVDDPKSILGTFKADNSDSKDSKTSNTIDISIKVRRVPTPAALEKALTVLSQTIHS